MESVEKPVEWLDQQIFENLSANQFSENSHQITEISFFSPSLIEPPPPSISTVNSPNPKPPKYTKRTQSSKKGEERYLKDNSFKEIEVK